MRWDEDDFTNKFHQAADGFDGVAISGLIKRLVEHLRGRIQPYPTRPAKDVLQILRNKRFFAEMACVADALLRNGVQSDQIERQYAQSLLDLGHVNAGLAILQDLLAKETITATERAEARGLIGRAYKQVYVDAADSRVPTNREALAKAITAYLGVYQDDKSRIWHGANAASLLKRAARDGVDISSMGVSDPLAISRKIAEEIRQEVEQRCRDKTATMWDLASAAEACIASENWKEGGLLMLQYVQDPRADAFELASTYRQFREVLQLDRDLGDERYLLDLLQGELLKRMGGHLVLQPSEIVGATSSSESADRKTALERVLGNTSYVAHSWLLQALAVACSVGRIWWRGLGHGTGFLLEGELLKPAWAGKKVLVTNNHVISTNPPDWNTARPSDVDVTFDALHGGGRDAPRFHVTERLWESPATDLDLTVLLLDRDPQPLPVAYAICPSLPETTDSRIYLAGHPKGGELSFSIQDNRFLCRNDTFIQYRSPTDQGSSGSPVFDDQWRLLAVHHAGGTQMRRLDDPSKVHSANEGILVRRACEAIAAT